MPNEEKTTTYDPSLGKNALAALDATLRALPADEVIPPNSGSEDSSLAALALVDVARRPDIAKRFALLPAEVFDPATIDRLEKAAWALWYTQIESRTNTATQATVKVSPEVMMEAQEVKGRMQKLLEYHLGDDPKLAPELADIRLGTGYADTASDLQRYARLSDTHRAQIEGDTKLFRKGDARRARELAGEILGSLRGSLADRASLTDQRNRVWTLLNRDHAEVVAAGTFLHRRSPEIARLFVPLRAAVVAQHTRRSPASEPTGGKEPGGDRKPDGESPTR